MVMRLRRFWGAELAGVLTNIPEIATVCLRISRFVGGFSPRFDLWGRLFDCVEAERVS
jgi:hypothetical protein